MVLSLNSSQIGNFVLFYIILLGLFTPTVQKVVFHLFQKGFSVMSINECHSSKLGHISYIGGRHNPSVLRAC